MLGLLWFVVMVCFMVFRFWLLVGLILLFMLVLVFGLCMYFLCVLLFVYLGFFVCFSDILLGCLIFFLVFGFWNGGVVIMDVYLVLYVWLFYLIGVGDKMCLVKFWFLKYCSFCVCVGGVFDIMIILFDVVSCMILFGVIRVCWVFCCEIIMWES